MSFSPSVLPAALLLVAIAAGWPQAGLAAARLTPPQVLQQTDGRFEVRHAGARITGFAFAANDAVQARLQDLNHDGVPDLIVANARPGGLPAGSRTPGDVEPQAGRMTASGGPVMVYSFVIPREGLPARVDVDDAADAAADSATRILSPLGDKDNFGHRVGNGPLPCVFYDLRDADDLGIFDYEAQDAADAVQSWTHAFEVTGRPVLLKLVTAENFSDMAGSTLRLDRIHLSYATEPFAGCSTSPGGVRRVFVLTGSDARIAADGEVTVVFKEQGDDIVLDRSRLVVKFRP